MHITRHAKRRSRQRSGVSKNKINEMASRAYNEGITHKEACGELCSWMDYEFFRNKSANECRLYANKLYIFHNKTLITVLNADLKFEQNLDKYVKSLYIYIRYKRNRIKRKRNPQLLTDLLDEITLLVSNDITKYINDISDKEYFDLYVDYKNIEDRPYYKISEINKSYQLILIYTYRLPENLDKTIKKYIKDTYGLDTQFKKYKKL